MYETIDKEMRDGKINGNDTVKVSDLLRWAAPAPTDKQAAAAPAPGAQPTGQPAGAAQPTG